MASNSADMSGKQTLFIINAYGITPPVGSSTSYEYTNNGFEQGDIQAKLSIANINLNLPIYLSLDVLDNSAPAGTYQSDVSRLTIPKFINGSPIARDDSTATPIGQAVTLNAFANDSDPESQALTMTTWSTPQFGSLSVNTTGGFITYTPTPGVTPIGNIDSFSYQIEDTVGATSDNATVTIYFSDLVAEPDNKYADWVPQTAARQSGESNSSNIAYPDVTIDLLANDLNANHGDISIILADDASGEGEGNTSSIAQVTIVNNKAVYDLNDLPAITDCFSYYLKRNDGSRSGLTVACVNAKPTPVDDQFQL
jgi:hypothetical protein